MQQYTELLEDIFRTGEDSLDRTGTGTRRVFGRSIFFDLRDGFPAVTHKWLNWHSVRSELLWFMRGHTNEKELARIQHGQPQTAKSTIWTKNAEVQGKKLYPRNPGALGPVYGHQWRNLGVDQLARAADQLRNDRSSRRIIVDSWNVEQLEEMALPPCNMMFQFFVDNKEDLHAQVYIRSWDFILGAPYNIASYAALIHLMAQWADLNPGSLRIVSGDTHIYHDHLEAVEEILSRPQHPLPSLNLGINTLPASDQSFDDWVRAIQPSDLELVDYHHEPRIRLNMSA